MYVNHPQYLASTILKIKKCPRIINRALVPHSPPKLCKIDDISSDAAFVADNSGEETDHRKTADDFFGEAGDGVGLFHVSCDEKVSSIGLAAGPASTVDVAQVEKRWRCGFAGDGVDLGGMRACLEGGEYRHDWLGRARRWAGEF